MAQQPSNVVFGFVQGTGQFGSDSGWDVGVGYRNIMTGGNFGWGVNATLGQGFSEEGNSALRGTIGAEAFTRRFDASIYAQFADHEDHKNSDGTPGELGPAARSWSTTTTSSCCPPRRRRIRAGDQPASPARSASTSSAATSACRATSTCACSSAASTIGPNNGDNFEVSPLVDDEEYDDLYGGKVGAEYRMYAPFGMNGDTSLFVNAAARYDNRGRARRHDDRRHPLRPGRHRQPPALPEPATGQSYGRIQDRMIDPIRRDRADLERARDRRGRVIEEFVYDAYLPRRRPARSTRSHRQRLVRRCQRRASNCVDRSKARASRATRPRSRTRWRARRPMSASPAAARATSSWSPAARIGDPTLPTAGLVTDGLDLSEFMIMMAGGTSIELTGATTGNTGIYNPADRRPGVISGTAGVTELLNVNSNNHLIGVGFTMGNTGIDADGVSHNRWEDLTVSLHDATQADSHRRRCRRRHRRRWRRRRRRQRRRRPTTPARRARTRNQGGGGGGGGAGDFGGRRRSGGRGCHRLWRAHPQWLQ